LIKIGTNYLLGMGNMNKKPNLNLITAQYARGSPYAACVATAGRLYLHMREWIEKQLLDCCPDYQMFGPGL
jgi:hypothetical protein